MSERKRKKALQFYVSEKELEIIQEKMTISNYQNMSTYLRKCAVDGYIIHVDTKDIRENSAQLQKIGRNINQLIKRTNETGHLYKEDIEEIKGLLETIWLTQRSTLLNQRLEKH